MNRPVVIINPLSSGIELAPAFAARGIPSIAVTLDYEEWPEFGSRIRASDFVAVIPDQPDIENIIARYDPIGIIPGTEEAIPLADRLTAALTPRFANDPRRSRHRSHKALMQDALVEAGVPALKSLHTASESEAEAWLTRNGLADQPLIIKPPASTGSEKVFHVAAGGDWTTAFRRILMQPVLSGAKSETVVIQEQAIGTEFAVGTVSAHGKHFLTHLMKYNKISTGEHRTVFDHVEFVPDDRETVGGVFAYTRKVLDALGVRFGAAHTEIMLTKNGPRLIESSPRMIGGPVVGFARAATGSSQADRLVELYADGDVMTREYGFKKTVVPVFLKAVTEGRATNVEVLDELSALPAFLSRHVWIKNGDRVPRTIDYLTAIGIVALVGDRAAIRADYEKVRALESELVFA